MARYTGPVCKLCRREGMKLFLKGDRCLTPKCAISRRNAPPGPRPQRRPPRPSDYGVQLREKQKARRTYGVLERQFRRHFAEANRRTGNTGENLLQVLESRLGQRGLSPGPGSVASRGPADRQPPPYHGQRRRCDIPSRLLRPSDVVAVRPKSRSMSSLRMSSPVPRRGSRRSGSRSTRRHWKRASKRCRCVARSMSRSPSSLSWEFYSR